MPDISMCPGNDCPIKDKCYRYTAIPSEYYQAYFAVKPGEEWLCEYFWLNTNHPNREKFDVDED